MEAGETIVFEQPWRTNTVTLAYEGIRGRYLPPGTRTDSSAGISDLLREGIVSWRYRLVLNPRDENTKLVLWEGVFPHGRDSAGPYQVGVLAYFIEPSLERVVVLSWDYMGPKGDICRPGVAGATNIISAKWSRFYPQGWDVGRGLPIAGKLLPGPAPGTYDATVEFEGGRSADFLFAGYRWRPKSPADLRPQKASSDAGEVVMFETVAGAKKVIGSYSSIDEHLGTTNALNAWLGANRSEAMIPFDRRYQLRLRSYNPASERVLWEKFIDCNSANDQALSFGLDLKSITNRFRFRPGGLPIVNKGNDAPAGTNGITAPHPHVRNIIGPCVTILGYCLTPELLRTAVVYFHRNRVFGEVAGVGSLGTPSPPEMPQFSLVNRGSAAPTATVTIEDKTGVFHATVTFGDGVQTNVVFDGKQWLSDPSPRKSR